MDQELRELAVELFEIQALKFGEFITKIGIKTPVYCDLRIIIAYPELMHKLSKILWKLNTETKIDKLCGVPYTALPIATAIAIDNKIPMLMKRKEAKSYGTKKLIEGKYESGDTCIIIEDVITSGSSILETVSDIRKEGLKVNQSLVVLDREQGGRENLNNNGIEVKSLFTLSSLMKYLKEMDKVNEEMVQQVANYTKNCQAPVLNVPVVDRLRMSFVERSSKSCNPISSKIFTLMNQKQTTLCLAADLTKSNEVLKLAYLAGPHIAVFKIHVDIIEDFSLEFTQTLKDLSKKHNFLIMEDRKFGDIGNTVALQFTKGNFKICDWADLVTVHCIAGPGSVSALMKVSSTKGAFLITEMSSENTLTGESYIRESVGIGEKYRDFVVGHVCQSNCFSDPGFIQMTPGVKLVESSDGLGQQYNTPENVVKKGADLVVVGRGITSEKDQLAAVVKYKSVLWEVYNKRINGEL